MKRINVLWPALLLLVAWDFLFWRERAGINVFLFAALAIVVLLLRNPGAWKRRTVQISGVLTLTSALMVMLHGPGWAVTAFVFSMAVFPCFVLEEKFRSVFFPLVQALVNFFTWPFAVLQKKQGNGSAPFAGRYRFFVKVFVLPLLVVLVFFLLYAWGNPHFGNLFSSLFDWLEQWKFSAGHFFFLVLGILVCGTTLVYFHTGLENAERFPNAAQRVRRKNNSMEGMSGLRREVKAGIVMLLLLNGLLLFVNGLDVARVWNQFVVPEHFSLKRFVHEGTWVLLLSIFLSMGVLLWLFRGNVHFYRRNARLKKLSYVWIAQNAFLAASLFKRNYHYIAFHGLAYGRIVVIAFLLLVLAGLITFVIKICRDRSASFLLRVNSWAAYALIVGMSLVNWDVTIVRFNLHHPNVNEIDVDFYLSVGYETLPELYANLDLVQKQIEAHQKNEVRWVYTESIESFKNSLYWKRNRYLEEWNKQNWQSWNYADAVAVKSLLAK